VNSLPALTVARRRLLAALLVALVALAPHAANAQPILRGKAQQASVAPTLWQPVASVFAGPGRATLPLAWDGAAQRLTPPVVIVEQAPAPISAPGIEQVIPLTPWLMLP
jgi:hypothetical protein